MKKINSKGFTLVELIATIVLLAIVMGIGAVSITAVINKSKEKDYQLLINEINNAVELYYQECRFNGEKTIDCPNKDDEEFYEITLGNLVTNGFIKGNSKDGENKFTLVNTKDDENIAECKIKYKYAGGKILIEAVLPTGSCPSTCDYNPKREDCVK